MYKTIVGNVGDNIYIYIYIYIVWNKCMFHSAQGKKKKERKL